MNVMKIVLCIKNWGLFYKFSIINISKILINNLFYLCICVLLLYRMIFIRNFLI